MSTPKGTRCRKIDLGDGTSIHVYSREDQLVVQIRKTVATEDDILAPSFKVAVPLRPCDALELASELLAVASSHIDRLIEIKTK